VNALYVVHEKGKCPDQEDFHAPWELGPSPTQQAREARPIKLLLVLAVFFFRLRHFSFAAS
jgi:hypothetical protein